MIHLYNSLGTHCMTCPLAVTELPILSSPLPIFPIPHLSSPSFLACSSLVPITTPEINLHS